MKGKRRGFTLVEIMLVIAIVGLLVSIALVEGAQLKKRAYESNCQANLKGIASGFEIYSVRSGGLYAPGVENNLNFLVDAGCLFQDLSSMAQVGNFRYQVALAEPAGYDIRGLAVNPALADHNYQITNGGVLKRSDSSSAGDTDFKSF